MARKIQAQAEPAARTQQTDAVFTQLLITAIRIYSDPAVNKR
jgi:hypothetical protein